MTTTYTSTELSPEIDAQFDLGLDRVRSIAGEYQLLIEGRWRPGSSGQFTEHNPGRLSEPIGAFAEASAAEVTEAIAAARRAQPGWKQVPVQDRIAILSRAAEGLRRRGGEIGAAMCLEVGKNRLECMGEVDEAVELIRYYSSQAAGGFDLELAVPSRQYTNRSVMRPFGVFGVIAPFNFPLALLIGPSAAALLAGNTVVAKPAPTTSLVSVLLTDELLGAGLPDGVFNLVTGGDEAGRALARSDVDGIVFTGSYAVGREIATAFTSAAAYARPAIIEMGGKNPAIVTASADLDMAAEGITRSAFGLSGQKCSACSRAIVHADVYPAMLERLIDRSREWVVADPAERSSRLGPVHTASAFLRYEQAIAMARQDGRVVVGGRTLRDRDLDGYYVEPTIVTDLPSSHGLVRQEQFLPLLVVECVRSLGDALASANDQVYGLTAGLFTRDEEELATFLDSIEAGTLFVNRAAGATTGGWPGQQTYPGWKGSGSTGRGGLGPRYVEQFLREQGWNIVDEERR